MGYLDRILILINSNPTTTTENKAEAVEEDEHLFLEKHTYKYIRLEIVFCKFVNEFIQYQIIICSLLII